MKGEVGMDGSGTGSFSFVGNVGRSDGTNDGTPGVLFLGVGCA